MGEYATFNRQRIKIGTCETMYYLRADQRHLIHAEAGNVDPTAEDDLKYIRFRFPFPDEDDHHPGDFENYNRSHPIRDVPLPEGVEHYNVQFSAPPGYLISLPCPEGTPSPKGVTIHRNGMVGPLAVSGQALRGEVWAVICTCRGCGALFNMPTLDEAQPIIDSLREKGGSFNKKMADRIQDGYQQPASV